MPEVPAWRTTLALERLCIVSNLDLNILLFRRSLIEGVLRQGVEVSVVVPQGRYAEKLEKLGVKVRLYPLARGSLNPFQAPLTILALRRTFQELDPDIIHSFTHQANLYARFAALRPSRVVHSITGLGSGFLRPGLSGRALRLLFKALYRGSSALCRALVFQNDADLAYFKNHRLTGQARTVCIRGSGVDTRRFTPQGHSEQAVLAAREALGLQPEHVVCTMSARLLYDKGIMEFVYAASALAAPCPQARFLLVGEPDPGNPKSLADDDLALIEGIGNVVRAGWRDDMDLIWNLSDVAVLPSYREGLPMSLQEALASGLPVVTTDVPGCREILDGSQPGLLVPPGDTHALAEAMRKLIESPALRRELGEAARRKAKQDFDGEAISAQHLELYASLLAEP